MDGLLLRRVGDPPSSSSDAKADDEPAVVPPFTVKLVLDWRMTVGDMKRRVIEELGALDEEVRPS